MFNNFMKTMPSIFSGGDGARVSPHAPNGNSGHIGGAVSTQYQGSRRDFTVTPQFVPGLTVHGLRPVPRA